MKTNNAKNEMRELIDPMVSSANRFAIIVVVVAALLALLLCFTTREFFMGIVHWVELVQAVLVCTTALMGLSGLMIIEIKKIDVTGTSSEDMFEKIKAIQTVTSLARAYVYLRWTMVPAIAAIIVSGLSLMMNNPAFLTGSIFTFLA
jgi:hypothetical protein